MTNKNINLTSSLRLVIFGQGNNKDRHPTHIRMSDRLREELYEVAEGPIHLLIEVAVRKLVDELNAKPKGSVQLIPAEEIKAEPALVMVPKRATRKRKIKNPKMKAA